MCISNIAVQIGLKISGCKNNYEMSYQGHFLGGGRRGQTVHAACTLMHRI